MFLIITSAISGMAGFMVFGSLFGVEGAFLGGLFGILCPALYVLNKLYNSSVMENRTDESISIEILDQLRLKGILTDDETIKVRSQLEFQEETEKNKIEYNKSLDFLYSLTQKGILSEADYNQKIDELKEIYKQ